MDPSFISCLCQCDLASRERNHSSAHSLLSSISHSIRPHLHSNVRYVIKFYVSFLLTSFTPVKYEEKQRRGVEGDAENK